MRTAKRLLTAAAATLTMTIGAGVSAQTISGPSNGANCLPFGCTFGGFASTRYQQVYRASAFAGPVAIGEIAFFRALPGDLNTMSFDIYLSTTSAPVDGLSSTFANNLGVNTSLFGSFTIGGAAPDVLAFAGTSYLYDPAQGNLLLDVRVTAVTGSANRSFFVARNNVPGGNYSRVTDFGTEFAGYGLDTRFGPGTVVPEPGTYALVGGGLVMLAGVARRRRV